MSTEQTHPLPTMATETAINLSSPMPPPSGLGRSLDSRVDRLFDELNKKIDRIAEKIRDKPSEDLAPFDIQEGAAESGIGNIPVAGDDRMTYVTPTTEVHSGVFVDEDRGDTIHVVTSLLSRVKTRVRKRGKAFCTP